MTEDLTQAIRQLETSRQSSWRRSWASHHPASPTTPASPTPPIPHSVKNYRIIYIWPHPHRGGSAAVPCGDGFGLRVGVVTRLDRAGAIAAPNKPAWAVGVVVQRCGATAKRTR